jgi:hypothetical protein
MKNLCEISSTTLLNFTTMNLTKTAIWICLSLLAVSCGEENKKVTADMFNFPQASSGTVEGDVPVIAFDSLDYNFGKVAIGEKVAHSYYFKNTGNAPLIIGQVTPSCGCTTLKDWPKDPIAPGQDGNITVEFNSSGFPGTIEKSILVSTNAVPNMYYLKLKGEVMGKEVKNAPSPTIEMERTR